jgi:N-dimethylarginine dimethylaminohydrolase
MILPKRPQMRFDVDEDLGLLLEGSKARRGEKNLGDTCRRLLREACKREALEDGIDTLTPILRKLIKEEFKVSENRIAKIVSKSANAAATTMYMCYQVLVSLGTKNMPAIYEAARKKGVAFVKTPLDEIMMDEQGTNREETS